MGACKTVGWAAVLLGGGCALAGTVLGILVLTVGTKLGNADGGGTDER